jgi:RTX calcium-binding nonapeptide repeat (4 copies)
VKAPSVTEPLPARAPRRRRLVAVLAIVLGSLALPAAGAGAATVASSDGTVSFTAVSGEHNQVVVTAQGGAVRVVDPGASQLRAGPGCSLVDPERVVSCPAAGLREVVVDTKDEHDVVRLQVDLPFRVDAGPGNDRVLAGREGGSVDGGPGDDQLLGDAGNDTLVGGAGDDTMQGSGGDDRLVGRAGADELDGEDGNDAVSGGDGDDLLTGGAGVDDLRGGTGNDFVDGGTGADRLAGDPGDDAVIAADATADEVLCGSGRDTGRADSFDRLDVSCEDLEVEGGPAVQRTLLPYPVVRIAGELTGSRTTIRHFQATVPAGTVVHVRCAGRGCPYRRRSWRTEEAQTLTIDSLEHRFAAGSTIEVFVTAPDRIGKYTRFIVRRRRAPSRIDRCVDGERLRAVVCGR